MGDLMKRADASQYDRGDVAFIILSGALVFLMIPGLAFLYSGLSRRKSALSLVWIVCAANAVVIFQWFFWGYSLAFSSTSTNGFIGNLRHFGLRRLLNANPSPGSPLIPELLYSFYEMEFACVTVGILVGAIAERGRVLPAIVFGFLWMTVVYCPLAYWVWNPNGWAFKWSVLDYAGGGPVEIGSGVGGLAYAVVLGRRKERELLNFRPHNVSLVALGTFLLWFGWLGFNAGSAFGANLRAITAAWNSMLSAAMGGITWCLLDYRLEKKYTMVGFCSGTIAGLIAATPSSGFVEPWAAFIVGIITGAVCNFATKLKYLLRVDDSLDLFAEHAVGGMIGLLWNGFFATSEVISLDGVNTSINGGWLNHNWKQLYKQFAYVCAVTGYTFVVTAVLAVGLNMIPGMQLRGTDEAESLGLDDDQIGEFANDYIEVRRDFDAWTTESPSSSRATEVSKEKQHHDSDETIARTRTQDGHVAAGARHGVPDHSLHHQHQGQGGHQEGSPYVGTDPEKPPLPLVFDGHVAAGDRHGIPDKG